MPDIRHRISIDAPRQRVHKLIATTDGIGSAVALPRRSTAPRATERVRPRRTQPAAGVSAATAGQEELWAALGEPSRLRVLDALLDRGDALLDRGDALLDRGDATPTMLAQDLPLTRQAVTKHLAVLGRVGLVAGRRQGREVRYAVDPDRLTEAARATSAVADRRLARIKAIAEAVHARRQLAAGDQ